MKRLFAGLLALCLSALLVLPVNAALPSGTGIIKSSSAVSGSEFSSKSSIAKKLNKMFAGDIGLYKDTKKTKPVNAALGTHSVPNNGVMQYWGPDPGGGGTSCFAYANAFYGHFYDGVYPHRTLNGNHKRIKATGKITYKNFVKWGVRDDAAVYIREGNHSIVVLHYDENYITYIDGNGDGKGIVALRKEAWTYGGGSNIYNSKPSLIVQPTTSYFASGSMGKKQQKPCSQGGSSHDWDGGSITKAASCKETGVKTFTCLECGKTKEETIKKTTEHKYGQWTVTKEATCTEKGNKTSSCEVCEKTQTKSVKALGHSYGKSVTVQESTIFAQGIMEKTCKRCEKVKTTNTPCTFNDEDLGITLTTKKKVFPKNTNVIVYNSEEQEEGYAELLQSGKFLLYSLEAQANEESVQPKGKVTLTLNLPEDFGDNLALYQIVEGAAQVQESTVEDSTLTTELESFGMFALCDLDVPYEPEPTETTEIATQPETQPETIPETQPATIAETEPVAPRTAPNTRTQRYMLMIGVLAVVFVAGLTMLILLLVREKRKKKAKTQAQEITEPSPVAEETEENTPDKKTEEAVPETVE